MSLIRCSLSSHSVYVVWPLFLQLTLPCMNARLCSTVWAVLFLIEAWRALQPDLVHEYDFDDGNFSS